MNRAQRLIKEKIDDVVRRMLRGDAKDYTAYASLVARHRVLKELDDELSAAPADDLDGDIEEPKPQE